MSELSLKTHIEKVEEQVKIAGQQLLAELAFHHDRGLVSLLSSNNRRRYRVLILGKDTGAAAHGPQAQHGVVVCHGKRGRE